MARTPNATNRQKCRDCMWLDTPWEGETCREAGIEDDSKPCGEFEYINPFEWLAQHPKTLETLERFKGQEFRIPRSLRKEIEDTVETLRTLRLPMSIRNQTDARRLQKTVSEAAALRSRLTGVVFDLNTIRIRISQIRNKLDAVLRSTNEVRKYKSVGDKDAVVSLVTDKMDFRLARISSFMETCWDAIKAVDTLHKSADAMIRAHYAVRDRNDS